MENNTKNRDLTEPEPKPHPSSAAVNMVLALEYQQRTGRLPSWAVVSVVQELKDIDMIDDNKAYTCAGCEPEEQHPDVDYCDHCGGE